jgi:hypothetical protein
MNIRDLYKKYGSGHIACIDDTVVAHDKTFKKVFETVKENGLLGNKHLVFRFIPPEESVLCLPVPYLSTHTASGIS